MSAEESLALLVHPDWWVDAACRGVGPSIFYISEPDPDLYDQKVSIATEFCNICPVRKECGEQGAKEKFGIWDGKDVTDESHRGW